MKYEPEHEHTEATKAPVERFGAILATGGAWVGRVALRCSFRLGRLPGRPPGWVAWLDLGSDSSAA